MLAVRSPSRFVVPSPLLERLVSALTTLCGLNPLGSSFTAAAGMPKKSSTLAEIDDSPVVSVVASFFPCDCSATTTVSRSPGKCARTSRRG